jgi:hypothetical protein
MICEDWFHSQVKDISFCYLFIFISNVFKHLGVPLPMEENEADQMDMICQACVTKHPFLAHYDG